MSQSIKTIVTILSFLFGTGSIMGLIKIINKGVTNMKKKRNDELKQLITDACKDSNLGLEKSVAIIHDEIMNIKIEIAKNKKDSDLKDAANIRCRILSFDLLTRQVTKKSRNKPDIYNFKNIFKDIDKYKDYKKSYSELNGEANNAITHIYKIYEEWYGSINE